MPMHHVRATTVPSLLLSLFFLTSCGDRAGVSGHRFTITQEDGIEVALTSGGPKFEGPLFRFEVERTLREDPAVPESMLFRPGTVHMDDEGFFYVLDRGDCRIVVYDPEGRYLRSFGGKGDGPGEFRGMDLLRLSGDELVIFDLNLQRTTRYRTNGTLLEVYRAPGSSRYSGRVEKRADGGFILFPMSNPGEEPEDPILSYSCDRIVVTDATGDTLCDLSTPWIQLDFKYQYGMGSGFHRMEFVGSPEFQYHPSRGIVMSTGVVPELTWYDLHGRVTARIRLDLPIEPVTAEEREQIRRMALEEYERTKERYPDHAKVMLERLQIPDVKAFWDRLLINDAGYYWLECPEPYQVQSDKGGPLFRVLSPEGEYLGLTRWPIGNGTFKDGCFMGMVADEMTGAVVPTIYRMVPLPAGFVYP